MKRTIIVAAATALVATIGFGGQGRTPLSMQRVLTNAVNGERQAIARYAAFAAKADEEGYPGAASLFGAMEKAEQIHLRRFIAVMNERNFAVPQEEPVNVKAGSTRDNLQSAVSLENGERDGIYLQALNTANEEHEQAIAKLFDETRDVEVEHANLASDALRKLDTMRVAHEYYVCERCGYTTEVSLPLCPSCRDRHPLHRER